MSLRGIAMRFDALSVLVYALCIAQSPASAQMPANIPRAQISEELRLDANAEDFPLIHRVFVSPNRRMFVPVPSDYSIVVFDSTGKRLGTIGRKGAGPGELGTPNIYVGWKGDTLWVNDGGQQRISYFGPNLRLVRTSAYPVFSTKITLGRNRGESGTVRSITPLAVQPDGTIVGAAYQVGTVNELEKLFGGAPLLVRFSARDGETKFLAQLPTFADQRTTMMALGFGDAVPFTFRPVTVASVTGDRIANLTSTVTRDSGAFTVTVLKANGDTTFVRTIPFRGVRIPQSARDSAISAIKAGEGGPELARRFQEIARAKMPAIYPGVESLVLGFDNTLWIGLHTAPEGQPFLVLNNKGNMIGTVLIPFGTKLKQASLQKVWAVQSDKDDLASVVRYRVTGLSCAAGDC